MTRRRPLDPSESAAALYGFKLRQHRDKHGWTQTALADRVDCSMDLISKIERAERTATPQMSARFDALFGTGEYFQELQPLAAREVLPDWFRAFPKYEAAANVIRIFELAIITGLLQKEDYIRELLQLEQPPDKIDALTAARLERQKILSRENPPHLVVVMDERALRHGVGGPEVMKAQLVHLTEMAQRQNITAQVVPSVARAYLGLAGPFMILTLDSGDVVHVPAAGLGPIIEEPRKVEEYRLRFDLIRASALSAEESLKLIQTVLENTRC